MLSSHGTYWHDIVLCARDSGQSLGKLSATIYTHIIYILYSLGHCIPACAGRILHGDRNVSILHVRTPFPRRRTYSKSVAAVRTPAGPICVTKNVVAEDGSTAGGGWRVRSENDFPKGAYPLPMLPITFIVHWNVSNGRWQSTTTVVQRSVQFLNWIRKVRQE